MPIPLPFAITRTARLVLDVREWLGTVQAGGFAIDVPGVGAARAIVRPETLLTVTATPIVPRDLRWPFAGPVELVTVRSPSGVLAFYGQVRSPNGPMRRLLLEGTRCDLRVDGPGYRATVLKNVAIPAKHDPPPVREVFLYPTGELPDAGAGPTILTGVVTEADGTALTGGLRVETDIVGVLPAEADENGVWLLELDPPGGPKHTTAGTVTLVFRDRAGAELHQDAAFRFQPRRLNRYPRTTLFGRVETTDGRPIRGAIVETDVFPGTTKTRPDGIWLFSLNLSQPTGGTRAVKIRVTTPGGPAGGLGPPQLVKFGQANQIPLITA